MTDRLRIAHCSDIHLGANGAGAADPCRARFARALDAMAADRPDLMLLAGDLFDTNSVGDDTVAFAMEALARLPFPVAMIPGNHDCLADDAVFRRHDFGRIANLRLLADAAGGSAVLPELGVSVWGKGMVEHSRDFRPLAGSPKRPEGIRWHLGMGHGLFVPRGEASERSSPIRMEEIEAAGFDYLALGHHHAAMELVTPSATAAYSGSPTDDVGRGATYAIVDLAAGAAPTLAIRVVG
ncbi:MAG: DNA repair exonuclease [Rhodospirillales bacterium]|nr:DNA repair exonuclease [Rhodospirillales bacterium]